MPAAILFRNIIDVIQTAQTPYPHILSEEYFLAGKPWYRLKDYNDYTYGCWLEYFDRKIQALNFATKTMEIELSLNDRRSLTHYIEACQKFLAAMKEIYQYSKGSRDFLLPDMNNLLDAPQQITLQCMEIMKSFNHVIFISQQQPEGHPHLGANNENIIHAFTMQVEQLSKQLEPGLGSKLAGAVSMLVGASLTLLGIGLSVLGIVVLTNPLVIFSMTAGTAALCLLAGLPCAVYGLTQSSHGHKLFSGWYPRTLKEMGNEANNEDCKQAIANTATQFTRRQHLI
jgi:hypothetical protein